MARNIFKIYAKAGSVKQLFGWAESEEEAIRECHYYDWEWTDENGFCWELDYEEVEDTEGIYTDSDTFVEDFDLEQHEIDMAADRAWERACRF